ncbi:hypothetical protein KDA_05080 [Dictyobacter alpinus]|uniref:Bacterial spore germination immunoglobulin-like domain-containing protein n=1 Tax=Dictyobacter alpinus TaxID=2014873 RepID=A0A402B0Z4_9CHLR|nr:hypothetical protein [Dictyobacter alpinus]GCE25024.1 hypothetical protein KDA_05080 [Dictyobacter alpinus]
MANSWQEPESDYQKSPHKPTRYKRPRPHLLTIILSILAILALAHFIAINHLSKQQPVTRQDCTSMLHTRDYTQLVPFQPRTQRMSAVQFINDVTSKQPAALLQVEDLSPQQKLDVYIYGCPSQQNTTDPALLFKQQGLVKGSIDVTQAHTISIGQIDTTLPTDSDTLLLPLQQNVFQEYAWHNGTFQRVAFPGLYPVTSRSEAEALQDEANNGQNLPWTGPQATAEQMAEDLLHWSKSTLHATLKDITGAEAHVLLERKDIHLTVAVTLERLVQDNSKGLWWVTNAQSPGISIDQSQFNTPVSSPLQLEGTIIPTSEKVTATLFNHTLTAIPLQTPGTLQTDEGGHLTGTLSYNNIFPDQPGLLLITEYPTSSKEDGRLLLTNIFLI